MLVIDLLTKYRNALIGGTFFYVHIRKTAVVSDLMLLSPVVKVLTIDAPSPEGRS